MGYPLVKINEAQKRKLKKLLENYGDPKTFRDYRFVKQLLDSGRDYRDFFQPSVECMKKVDLILKQKGTKNES